VTFVVGKTTDGRPAETSGTTVTLSRAWFTAHPDDAGAIVHEMVHAFQQVPEGAANSKLIENMADAVRYKLGLTYAGWTPDAGVLKLSEMDPQQFRSVSQRISSTDTKTAAKNGVYVYDPQTHNVVRVTADEAAQMQKDAATTAATGAAPPGFTWTLNGKEVPAGTEGAVLTYTGGGASGTNPKDAEAAYNTIIQGYGLAADSGLAQLTQRAIKGEWSAARFRLAIQDTPEFHQAFPGIFKADGTLKMSPAQYIAAKNQYDAIAAQAGIDVNAKTQAWLFRNNVSPAEFQARAAADTTLRTNQRYFDAFNQELKANGQAPLTHAQQLKFIMGEGNQDWYDLWQGTTTRYAAEQAGLKVKAAGSSYLDINQHMLDKVSQLGLSEEQAQAGWSEVANHLLTTYPLSKLEHFNLNKRKIEAAVFGGPGSAQAQQLMKRVLAQGAAFSAPRANPALQQSAKGGAQQVGYQERAQGQ